MLSCRQTSLGLVPGLTAAVGLLNRVGPSIETAESSRPVHQDSPNRVGPFAEAARPRQPVSVGSLVEQLDRSFLLSSLLQDSPSWGLLRHVVCDIVSSLQPMLCHHSIGGSIQIVEEYIVGQYYDRCSLVDCNHLQDEMLDVFIRAALFLLQNQVTNTSGTSSNRVRCDQTFGW